MALWNFLVLSLKRLFNRKVYPIQNNEASIAPNTTDTPISVATLILEMART